MNDRNMAIIVPEEKIWKHLLSINVETDDDPVLPIPPDLEYVILKVGDSTRVCTRNNLKKFIKLVNIGVSRKKVRLSVNAADFLYDEFTAQGYIKKESDIVTAFNHLMSVFSQWENNMVFYYQNQLYIVVGVDLNQVMGVNTKGEIFLDQSTIYQAQFYIMNNVDGEGKFIGVTL